MRTHLPVICAAALLLFGTTGCGVVAGIAVAVASASSSGGGGGGGVPAPTVTTVSPAEASHGGGSTVEISGTNFPPNATVSVGGVAATNVTVTSPTRLTAMLPRLLAIGPQPVVVTNPAGGSGTLASGVTYTNAVPAASLSALSGSLSQNVVVQFMLMDPEADTVDIRFEVDSGNGVFTPVPASHIVGGTLTGLPSSPQGVLSNLTWNSSGTFPGQNAGNVRVRVVPIDTIDSQAGTPGTSELLSIVNNLPIAIELVQPGADAFNVVVGYRVTDPNPSDLASVSGLTWTDLGSGASGNMTIAGGQGIGPVTSPGTTLGTVWSSLADLGFGNNKLVRVSVTVSDGSNQTTSTSAPFFVSNGPIADQQVFDALIDVQGFVLADLIGNDGRPDIVVADTNTPFLNNLPGQASAIQNRGQDFANAVTALLPVIPGVANNNGAGTNFFIDDNSHPSEATAIDADGDADLDLYLANSVHGPHTTQELLQNIPTVIGNVVGDGPTYSRVLAHQVLYRVPQVMGAISLGGGTYEDALAPNANRSVPHDGSGGPLAYTVPRVGGLVQDLVSAELDPAGSGGGPDLLTLHGVANVVSLLPPSQDLRGAVTIRKRAPGGLQAAPAGSFYLDQTVMGRVPVHAAVADITSVAHTGGFPVAPNGPVAAGLPDIVVACSVDNSLTFYLQTAASPTPDTTPGTFHGLNLPLGPLYAQLGFMGIPSGDVRGVAIGDLNGDGANDLVVVHQLSRVCLVFVWDPASGGPLSLNAANPNYPTLPAGLLPFRLAGAFALTGIQCGRPAIKDVSGDGLADLVVPLRFNNEVVIYVNRGNQAAVPALGQSTPTPLFGPGGSPLPPSPSPVVFTTSFQPFEAAIQDVNQDRRDDVITPCGLSFDVSVFLQTTPGSLDRFVPVPAGGSPFLLEAGDVSGDGAPDLAISMTNQNALFVFQRAPGVLLSRTHTFDVDGPTGMRTDPVTGSITAPTLPFALSVVDATGDGRPDILSAVEILTQIAPAGLTRGGWVVVPGGPLAADIAVVRSSGTFAPIGFDVDAGDIVGADGIPDVVLSNNQGAGHVIHQGLGGGAFAIAPIEVGIGSGTQVTVTDLNGDGRVDIVIGTGNFTQGTRVFYGRASGAAPTGLGDFQQLIFPTLGNPVGLVVADVGGPLDGMGQPMLDIIITGFTLQSGGILYQTSPGSRTDPGSGGFVPPTFQAVTLTVGGEPAQIAVGDLDSDGLADIAIPWGRDNLLAVYYRNPSPTGLADTFFGPALFPTANSPVGCAIVDVDGDGRNDVVVTARGANSLNVFLQR